jgi:hypothetical protein
MHFKINLFLFDLTIFIFVAVTQYESLCYVFFTYVSFTSFNLLNVQTTLFRLNDGIPTQLTIFAIVGNPKAVANCASARLARALILGSQLAAIGMSTFYTTASANRFLRSLRARAGTSGIFMRTSFLFRVSEIAGRA